MLEQDDRKEGPHENTEIFKRRQRPKGIVEIQHGEQMPTGGSKKRDAKPSTELPDLKPRKTSKNDQQLRSPNHHASLEVHFSRERNHRLKEETHGENPMLVMEIKEMLHPFGERPSHVPYDRPVVIPVRHIHRQDGQGSKKQHGRKDDDTASKGKQGR